MKQNPLFENIQRDFKSSTPIWLIGDKAYFYGVSLDNISSTIQYLISGKSIGDFMIGNDVYDVILQYKPNDWIMLIASKKFWSKQRIINHMIP